MTDDEVKKMLDRWFDMLPIRDQTMATILLNRGEFGKVIEIFKDDPTFPLKEMVELVKQ